MIKHVVMWKLKDSANGCSRRENAQKVKALLETMPAKIEQIKSLQVGIGELPEGDGVYDICLITEFESLADLDIYQIHPEHKAVAAIIGEVRTERAIIDFEV